MDDLARTAAVARARGASPSRQWPNEKARPGEVVDDLERTIRHLDSMLVAITASGAGAFNEMTEEARDDYLCAARDLSDRAHYLALTLYAFSLTPKASSAFAGDDPAAG